MRLQTASILQAAAMLGSGLVAAVSVGTRRVRDRSRGAAVEAGAAGR